MLKYVLPFLFAPSIVLADFAKGEVTYTPVEPLPDIGIIEYTNKQTSGLLTEQFTIETSRGTIVMQITRTYNYGCTTGVDCADRLEVLDKPDDVMVVPMGIEAEEGAIVQMRVMIYLGG